MPEYFSRAGSRRRAGRVSVSVLYGALNSEGIPDLPAMMGASWGVDVVVVSTESLEED